MLLRGVCELNGLRLGGDLSLENSDQLAVGKGALGVDLLALLGASDFADLSGQVELDGGAEDIHDGHALGGLGNESLEHGGVLGASAEVLEDELLHGGGASGLGVNVADEGLGAVVVVVDGSLKHDLLDLDGVVFAAFDGSAPTSVTSEASATASAVPVGEGVPDLEADEGADQEALDQGGGDEVEDDGEDEELHVEFFSVGKNVKMFGCFYGESWKISFCFYIRKNVKMFSCLNREIL